MNVGGLEDFERRQDKLLKATPGTDDGTEQMKAGFQTGTGAVAGPEAAAGRSAATFYRHR